MSERGRTFKDLQYLGDIALQMLIDLVTGLEEKGVGLTRAQTNERESARAILEQREKQRGR